jgi:hypothetical protein
MRLWIRDTHQRRRACGQSVAIVQAQGWRPYRISFCVAGYRLQEPFYNLARQNPVDWTSRPRLAVTPPEVELTALADEVMKRMPQTGFISYLQVADSMGEDPWDVLDACRALVRLRHLKESGGSARDLFART